MSVAPRAKSSTYVGLFLVTLATLFYELLLTRIFSVTMWYHFAFMAVSVAMFGMTVGAVIVYLRPERYRQENVEADLAANSVWFAVTVVASFLTLLSIPFVGKANLLGLWSLALTFAVVAVPFVFSGIAVALALTRFPRETNRLYAVDLIGAALACIGFVVLMQHTDGPSAVFAAAACAAAGGVAFGFGATASRARGVGALVVLACAALSIWGAARAAEQKPLLRLNYVKGAVEPEPRWEKWNSFSRIAVFGDPNELSPPSGWGLSRAYPKNKRTKKQLGLNIDATAATVMTNFEDDFAKADHLKHDITNLVHYLRPESSVLVVGVGGGRDVLSALTFEQKKVTGVEINDDILAAVTGEFGEFTGHLDRRPGVELVNDEARSWIARTDQSFDILQVSLIDTWAATAAGAFTFTENSLYTLEAWKLFLTRLTPRGVLSFSRWFFPDRPGEIYRLATLANAALRSQGVEDPRKHVIIVTHLITGGIPGELDAAGVGTMLLAKEPFTDDDLNKLDKVVESMEFNMVLSPRVSKDPLLEEFVTTRDLDGAVGRYELDVSPPTDDRPFFFHMLRLADALKSDLWRQGDMSFNMKAVALLMALLVVVFGLTLACIVVPLALTTRRGELAGTLPFFLFFGAIGVGFMLIEISQMQRLIVFLGHPVYGFSVVLFSLLLASGLGSFSTQLGRAGRDDDGGTARLVLLLIVVAIFGAATPFAIERFASATTTVRIAVATGLLLPLGLVLGMAFPLGMKLAGAKRDGLTPWLWGINGATGVCASVVALVVSLAFGITTTFWVGGAFYVLALAAYAWSRKVAPRAVTR
ncbi:MAG: hypothetical protein K8S98_14785 [Planctomycetes bacterium]|nr:hypothetical protein [Planctomycetota bacterium]